MKQRFLLFIEHWLGGSHAAAIILTSTTTTTSLNKVNPGETPFSSGFFCFVTAHYTGWTINGKKYHEKWALQYGKFYTFPYFLAFFLRKWLKEK